MYKTFAKDRAEALRQSARNNSNSSSRGGETEKGLRTTTTAAAATATNVTRLIGMHAARCFLGALSGYEGSGWLAAEGYACTVLPSEVKTKQKN